MIDFDTRRRLRTLEDDNAFLRRKLYDVLEARHSGLTPIALMNACDALDHPAHAGERKCYCGRMEVRPTTT